MNKHLSYKTDYKTPMLITFRGSKKAAGYISLKVREKSRPEIQIWETLVNRY